MDQHLPLPAGFLMGAATAPHQVEGDNVHSDWWQWETAPDSEMPQPSGTACDSYHRWPEDMDLLARAGYNAYRFGIEWARIEPEEGRIDAAEVQHYRDMVEGAVQRGLTPVVTLHHFTNPAWFSSGGGWTRPDAVAHFSAYVRRVLPVLGDEVRTVVTINEPNMAAIFGRAHGGERPEPMGEGLLPAPDSTIAQRLIEAHRAASDILHGELPAVRVGWSVASQDVQGSGDGVGPALAYSQAVEDQFLFPAAEDDFIAVQSYTRTVFGPDGNVTPAPTGIVTDTNWEFWPSAVGEVIRHTHELLPHLPILVSENGIATRDDARRIDYLRGALPAVAQAMRDGIEVLGYLHWSLLDNYEWGSWDPHFGLIGVDRESGRFERTPKPSFDWLAGWARRGALPLGS